MLAICPKNVRPITWITVILAGFVFLFSASILYHNANWSIERIKQIVEEQGRSAHTRESQQGDKGRNGPHVGEAEKLDEQLYQNAKDSIPEFYRPLMQDLSMVSPALSGYVGLAAFSEGLFFLFPGLAFYRRSKGTTKETISARNRSPFPASYQIYFVQVGLIGTLVAFVIAFSNLQPTVEAQFQTKVLLESLGTALYSTLVALVFAYLVCPSIEPFFSRLAQQSDGVSSPGTVDDELEEMREKVVDVTAVLDELGKGVRKLNETINMEMLNSKMEVIEDRLNVLNKRVDDQEVGVGNLKSGQKEQGYRLDSVQSDIQVLQQKEEVLEGRRVEVEKRLGQIEESVGAIDQIIANIRNVIK